MASGNRGPELAAVCIAFTASSIVSVALRCYTMVFVIKRFFIQDWLAVITLAAQCAFCAFVLLSVHYGLGQHVGDVPLDQRPTALMWKYAGLVAYVVVSTLMKFVVGIFLFRLSVEKSWQRITIWILLIVVGLFNTFYVFLAIFQCVPIQYYWYRLMPNPPVTGSCNSTPLATVSTYISMVLGVLADWILALLPITLIRKARLDVRTKISVVCVLSLGSLASLATIARIPYAKEILTDPDYLYNFTDLAIWSVIECGLAITASSLATLRPLLVKFKILAQNSRASPSKQGASGNNYYTGKPRIPSMVPESDPPYPLENTGGRMQGDVEALFSRGDYDNVSTNNMTAAEAHNASSHTSHPSSLLLSPTQAAQLV